MKNKKSIIIVSIIGAVVLCAGIFLTFQIISKNELKKYQLVEQNTNAYIINYPQSMKEAEEQSELVIRCKVESLGEIFYASNVTDSVREKLVKDGAKEWEYSNIWTNCVLKVEEVYKGKCDKKIDYQFLGGTIDGHTETMGYSLEEGEEYILFLNYSQDDEVYRNAISPYYVMKKGE